MNLTTSPSAFGAARGGGLRWHIAIMVSVAIANSYMDRMALPIAIKGIQEDIPITNQQFSLLQTAFLFTYALMYMGGGKLMDVLGTRRGFTVIMIFWALACAANGLATSFAMLVFFRILLGIGEGGGFPAATRVTSEWFPTRERSTAMGIMNAGTAVGMILAAPTFALIMYFTNWRWVFVVSGGLSLLWVFWWLHMYYLPEKHPRLGSGEKEYLREVVQANTSPEPKVRWLQLLKYRQTWGIVLAKFLSDAAWYFILLWLPKYLYDARGFDVKQIGTFAWIPPVGAGVGCIVGGWLSSWLLTRQFSVNRSRKMALGLSAAVMPLLLFVPSAPVSWAIALFTFAYFGQQSWSTLVMTLPTDLFPKNAIGSVAGLVGFGGAMGGVAFNQLAGYLLDHGHGWTVVFALAGSFHVIAFLLICVVIPRIQPISIPVPSVANPGQQRVALEKLKTTAGS
jgi:MFS transporter, ACS family, hexuronate transporter